MRLALLCASFLFASGCYLTHVPDGDGRRPCGSVFCEAGEACCMGCALGLDAVCRAPGLPCPSCTDCRSSLDCDFSDLCEFAPGTCGGGVGSCVPRPSVCDGDCPGVCGCDGNDYCNECEARGNGEMVSSFGFCDGEDFCPDGTPCDGVCCEDCFGGFVCIPSGESCGDIFCAPECFGNEDCAPTDFCRLDECRRIGTGVCTPRPEVCDGGGGDCPGVCGCDGNVYCLECTANARGVSITTSDRSSCPGLAPPCGGRTCDASEYCDLGPECGALDGQRCLPIPDGCDDDYVPVCGCDGITYSNACEAAFGGATVRSPNVCR